MYETFLNYVKKHYLDMVKLATEIWSQCPHQHPRIFSAILEKLLSPAAYLWEKFDILPVEEKIKYATPKYQEKLEKLKQEAEQQAKQIFKKEGESFEG